MSYLSSDLDFNVCCREFPSSAQREFNRYNSWVEVYDTLYKFPQHVTDLILC